MADLPSTTRINFEELPGDVPLWFRNVLEVLNELLEKNYVALDSNINFIRNMDASFGTIQFRTSSTYGAGDWTDLKFTHTLRGKAQGVMIAQIYKTETPSDPIKAAVSVDWTELNGQICVRWIDGLTNDTAYTVRLLAYR